MQLALWKVGFGSKKEGDNWSSRVVTAKTGEEAITKAKKLENGYMKELKDSVYIDGLTLIGRVDP